MTEKPVVAQKGPYVLDMEPGTYWWCACGRSAGQPFCDGAHKGTGFVPVKVDIAEKRRVAWCGCKASGSGCECDGSHRNV